MRKKYIYISLLISTGIYAIADYYCIYNFTFTLLFTIFLIFNLVNSVICFAKNSCEFSIIASIIYVFMIMHNLFVLAFNKRKMSNTMLTPNISYLKKKFWHVS